METSVLGVPFEHRGRMTDEYLASHARALNELPMIRYPLPTAADLEETATLVEAAGASAIDAGATAR
jgi:hypothetical protein